ncbi:copper resistance protein CopC [Microtetraspora sp. AC03309]|uniref:copper resistance CopC family protein n=1 Tax=Microtetraspora sp. AC03309 TaxID=2779376 RepID=UPI001E2F3C15|nr:copper resistance CopC family protein [Microtetraspora sp. AC03309]MCC5578911.1 copper resistance protein CopC [Microtetraspora sp. AC03309]
MRKSPLAALIAFVATLLLGTALAMPALAHTSLKSSDPKENARVDGLTKVSLVFTESVRFPVVLVRGSDGKRYETGDPTLDGPKVTQAVADSLPAGAYSVAWRVVSTDGHPIEGEIPFTVVASEAARATPDTDATPTASAPTPGIEPSVQPSVEPSVEPTAGPTFVQAGDDQAQDAQDEGGQGGVPAWVWIAVFGVAGIGIGMALSMRKKP